MSYRTIAEQTQLTVNAAAYMRLKLAENAHKPHWLAESIEALGDGLERELAEYRDAFHVYAAEPTPQHLEALRREAGDVHNYLEFLIEKAAKGRPPLSTAKDAPRQ